MFNGVTVEMMLSLVTIGYQPSIKLVHLTRIIKEIMLEYFSTIAHLRDFGRSSCLLLQI
jgi:hypothetical protein